MMDKKIVGVLSLVAVLCFSIFLATGDNQASAANSTTQTAQVYIPPHIAIEAYWNGVKDADIDFGTLLADGSAVNVAYNGNETLRDFSNVDIDVWANSSANVFTSGSNSFDINNLVYTYNVPNAAGGDTGSYSTSAVKVIDTWARPQGTARTATVDYSLTIPVGTPSGTYTVNIMHYAIGSGSTSPV